MSSSLNRFMDATGNIIAIADWLHWPLYSTVDIEPGDGVNLVAFGYIPGDRVAKTRTAPDREATLCDTNMDRRGLLNQDESFVGLGFTWEPFALEDIDPATLAEDADLHHPAELVNNPAGAYAPYVSPYNMARLRQSLTYQITVGANIKKGSLDVPLEYLPQSIGPKVHLGTQPGPAGAAVVFGQAGRPVPKNQWRPDLPVTISGSGDRAQTGNKRRFGVRLQSHCDGVPGLTQRVALRLYLDGLRKRPA